MTIAKMNRVQLAGHLEKLWAVHERAVADRKDTRDREALNKLAKALGMPAHVRTVLDWALVRAESTDGPDEIGAWDQAYDAAKGYVKSTLAAWKSTAIYDYSENRRQAAKFEGACAGYYFKALEIHGV